MAFTKITAAGIGSTETVTLDGVAVINNESIGGNLTVTGNATIGGVLTYEDVTNVDSVGVITARAGVLVGSGITLSKDGDGFFTGIVTATTFSGTFSGDGTSLTGVASTDNIRTNTNATFLQNVNVSGTTTATNFIGGGANLTALNSTQLTSGTIPDARFPATLPAVSGAQLTGISVGVQTEAASIAGITTYLNLSKDDHELVVTGTNTISVIGGSQGGSHTLRIQNSGIATVTLDSTYFKFPSGAAAALPTADGSISLVSFTVHKAGAVGVNTVLLTGASVNFS